MGVFLYIGSAACCSHNLSINITVKAKLRYQLVLIILEYFLILYGVNSWILCWHNASMPINDINFQTERNFQHLAWLNQIVAHLNYSLVIEL